MRPPHHSQVLVPERLHTDREPVDTAGFVGPQRLLGEAFGIGLQCDLAARRDRKGLPAGIEEAADCLRLCCGGSPASEEDRRDRRLVAAACGKREDVLRDGGKVGGGEMVGADLRVEVAVPAADSTEGNVDVEACRLGVMRVHHQHELASTRHWSRADKGRWRGLRQRDPAHLFLAKPARKTGRNADLKPTLPFAPYAYLQPGVDRKKRRMGRARTSKSLGLLGKDDPLPDRLSPPCDQAERPDQKERAEQRGSCKRRRDTAMATATLA